MLSHTDPQAFLEALGQLDIPDPREHRRYPCDLIALLDIPDRPAEDRLIQILDLSCGGAKLRSQQPICSGQHLRLNLCCQLFPEPLTLRIHYAAEAAAGDWLVGGQWLQPLAEEHLQALINSLAHTSTFDIVR